jgi:hypothetical protein
MSLNAHDVWQESRNCPRPRLSLLRLLTLVAVAALLVAGCTISKPKAPTWDTDFTIPLITHTYDMVGIFDRIGEDVLLRDTSGQLALSFKCKIKPAPIKADLSLPDTVGLKRSNLGNVLIVLPPSKTVRLKQAEFRPTSPGERAPEFEIKARVNIPVMETFDSATFAEGKLVLTIVNRSDFPFDSLSFSLKDNSSGQTITAFEFVNGLDTGKTESDTTDISGKTFSNNMSLDAVVSSPGGTYSGDSNKYLEITLAFSDSTKVSSGVVAVAPQAIDLSGRIEIAHRSHFLSGTLDSGQINLDVVNHTGLAAEAHIEVIEIKQNGSPLTIDTLLPPVGLLKYLRDIGGCELVLDNSGGIMALNVGITVHIYGTGTQRVRVDADSQYQVTASLVGVRFRSATGYFESTAVSLPTTTYSLQVPKGFENVYLPDASLTVTAHSTVDLPVETNITIAWSGGGNLFLAGQLGRGRCGAEFPTNIPVNGLNGLTTPLPSEITVSGMATIGGSDILGTVCNTSALWGEIEIKSPLKIELDTAEFEGDLSWTRIDQKNIDEISNRLIFATLYATLTNHLPVAAKVYLYLAGEATDVYKSPDLRVGPFEIAAGGQDSTVSNVVCNLAEKDLKVIRRPVLYVGSRVRLSSSLGEAVSIIPSDYLAVQSYIKVTTRMGGDH